MKNHYWDFLQSEHDEAEKAKNETKESNIGKSKPQFEVEENETKETNEGTTGAHHENEQSKVGASGSEESRESE